MPQRKTIQPIQSVPAGAIENWARQTGRLHDNNPYAEMLELEGIGWEGNLNEMRMDRVEEL